MTHFFPPKALQFHNRYLHWGLFKPRDSNLLIFFCHVNNIVEYLKHLPPFGTYKGLPNDKIINLAKFTLSHV